jgi:hypothetical protein
VSETTNSVAATLEKMGPDLEREIAPRLQGFMGSILRSYLPQTWVLRTESETASLTVDRQGKATITPKALPNPDVTIQAKRSILLASLTQGSKARAATSDFHVTMHTSKGKTAFEFLRQRFGF